MKNKRSVYILLPLVLIIWGLIAQRIWSAASDQQAESVPSETLLKTPKLVDRQHPRLLLTYGDPFQQISEREIHPIIDPPVRAPGTVSVPQPVVTPALNIPIATASAATSAVVWPQVKYLGLIMSAGGKNTVALLTIDNQDLLVKVGENVHDMQLVKVSRDSVQLKMNKQAKTFYRNAPVR